MPSQVQADLGGGVNVLAVRTSSGIQYTINLASGASAGPYTGDQLIDVGSGLRSFPPPAEFRLSYKNNDVVTSTNPSDVENGPNIVVNLFGIQKYAEEQLAVDTATNAADKPAGTETTAGTTETPPDTKTVVDDGSDPYVNTTTGDTTIAPQVDNVDPYVDTVTGTTTVAPQDVIDDGSDPFVSNGATTIPLPQPQKDVEENVFNPGTTINAGEENVFNPAAADPNASSNSQAQGAKRETQATATKQDSASFQKAKDWRVRLSLAPKANYLYNADDPGILAPLSSKSGTNGVIFPYTPAVSVSYAAGYDATDIAHSNYKIFQYKGSSVDSITITGDFTAQDTNEANYLLAVIHFFRSVTKMFYGQDQNPNNGVPPPLVYLSGFGTYQFDNHPMAITGFTYATPTDVDYIRAGSQTNMPGQSVSQQPSLLNSIASAASAVRLLSSNLTAKTPNFQKQNSAINSNATYVPTKISLSITAIPIVTRNDISNNFSLKKYATGELLKGSSRPSGGGIW